MKRLIAWVAALVVAGGAGSTAALCTTEDTELREGPGRRYGTKWNVSRYTPAVKVGASLSGDWYAMRDVDGDVGWLPKRLLTARYRCAVVKVGTVNVRTGPGTRYALSPSGKALKYYAYPVVREKGQWVQLKDEWGTQGWIHRDYLWMQ